MYFLKIGKIRNKLFETSAKNNFILLTNEKMSKNKSCISSLSLKEQNPKPINYFNFLFILHRIAEVT